MRKIIVTGANSMVGRRVMERLGREPGVELEAWVSDRPDQCLPAPSAHCLWRAADLRAALPADAVEALSRCDVLLHLAWARSPTPARAIAENSAILHNLLRGLRDPGRLRIVSSVSSGPGARSAYGKAKFTANQLALEIGASALLLGLVVEPEPETGPYRMLRKLVYQLPLRIRFIDRNPNLYPVRAPDALDMLCTFGLRPDLRGLFRGFPPPLGINRFLSLLEQSHPRRRLPLPLFAAPVQGIARLAAVCHLPGRGLLDKVATILHKDDDYLLSFPSLPGAAPQACVHPDFFS